MTTKIDIINRALRMIGADPITSLSDETTEAQVADVLYPQVVEDLLSRYPWRFTAGQTQLSRILAEPAPPWAAAYELPVAIEQVTAIKVDGIPIRFDRYEDMIFCNANTNDVVIAEHTAANNETFWPGYFITLVVFELAATIAIPVGDRQDLAEIFERKALRHFGLAKNIDARSRTAPRFRLNRFIAVRGGTQ